MRRFIRYCVVGGSTLALDLGLLYLLTAHYGVAYYIATPITFLIAVSINYAISRNYVFEGTKRLWHHGYFYFAGMALVGAFLTTFLVTFLVTYADLQVFPARLIVAIPMGLISFFVNLHFNFKVANRALK